MKKITTIVLLLLVVCVFLSCGEKKCPEIKKDNIFTGVSGVRQVQFGEGEFDARKAFKLLNFFCDTQVRLINIWGMTAYRIVDTVFIELAPNLDTEGMILYHYSGEVWKGDRGPETYYPHSWSDTPQTVNANPAWVDSGFLINNDYHPQHDTLGDGPTHSIIGAKKLNLSGDWSDSTLLDPLYKSSFFMKFMPGDTAVVDSIGARYIKLNGEGISWNGADKVIVPDYFEDIEYLFYNGYLYSVTTLHYGKRSDCVRYFDIIKRFKIKTNQ